MPNESRELIHTELLKTVRSRINSVLPIPDDVQMSLACALNLLFLLVGTHGSIGDYSTTYRAFRALVGDKLLWADPPAKVVLAVAELVQ